MKGVSVLFDSQFNDGWHSDMDIMLIATWDGTKHEIYTDIGLSKREWGKILNCVTHDIGDFDYNICHELVGHNLHGDFDFSFDLLREIKLVSADVLQNEVVVLGGGVDTEIFYPGETSNSTLARYNLDRTKERIVFVGRHSPEKGIDTLLDAFDDPSFAEGKQLVFMGADRYPDDFHRRVTAIDADVNLIDHSPQDVVADVMRAADVVVVPSRYESFGLVCVEALACDAPVVGSNVGVLSDLIQPPYGGTIFEINNQEKFEKSIESEAIIFPSKIRHMGVAPKENFHRFNLNIITQI